MQGQFRQIENQISLDSATVERRTVGGRDYLVFPIVALKEMVYDYPEWGRQEYLPGENIERSTEGWNDSPLVVPHPPDRDDGKGPTAKSVSSWHENTVGRFHEAETIGSAGEQRLRGEAWVDVEKVEQMGPDAQAVLTALQNGRSFDVSAGYRTYGDQDTEGKFNGERYQAVQGAIEPDHIALLPPGMRGRCSRTDGCGAPRLNQQAGDLDAGMIRTNRYDFTFNESGRNPGRDGDMRGQYTATGIPMNALTGGADQGQTSNGSVSVTGNHVIKVNADIEDLTQGTWVQWPSQGSAMTGRVVSRITSEDESFDSEIQDSDGNSADQAVNGPAALVAVYQEDSDGELYRTDARAAHKPDSLSVVQEPSNLRSNAAGYPDVDVPDDILEDRGRRVGYLRGLRDDIDATIDRFRRQDGTDQAGHENAPLLNALSDCKCDHSNETDSKRGVTLTPTQPTPPTQTNGDQTPLVSELSDSNGTRQTMQNQLPGLNVQITRNDAIEQYLNLNHGGQSPFNRETLEAMNDHQLASVISGTRINTSESDDDPDNESDEENGEDPDDDPDEEKANAPPGYEFAEGAGGEKVLIKSNDDGVPEGINRETWDQVQSRFDEITDEVENLKKENADLKDELNEVNPESVQADQARQVIANAAGPNASPEDYADLPAQHAIQWATSLTQNQTPAQGQPQGQPQGQGQPRSQGQGQRPQQIPQMTDGGYPQQGQPQGHSQAQTVQRAGNQGGGFIPSQGQGQRQPQTDVSGLPGGQGVPLSQRLNQQNGQGEGGQGNQNQNGEGNQMTPQQARQNAQRSDHAHTLGGYKRNQQEEN